MMKRRFHRLDPQLNWGWLDHLQNCCKPLFFSSEVVSKLVQDIKPGGAENHNSYFGESILTTLMIFR